MPLSAVGQFLALSGETWLFAAAVAKPDMNFCVVYGPPVSWAVYGGKKPCRLANEVEFAVSSMTEIRSQSACGSLLVLKIPRSEPPAKTGAEFGPFSLGIGNEAQSDFVLMWLDVGLGLATMLGGRLHRGTAGAAGEIGYLPVHGAPLHTDIRHPASGGFQSLAGGAAVRALAARYGFPAPTAAGAVAAAVSSPSAGSTAFLDDLAQRVAVGVASVCVVLDPGLVVLGGAVGRAAGTALASWVAAAVAAIFPARPRVVPTGVPGEPVLRGAMLAAVDQARAALLASVADPNPLAPAPVAAGHRAAGRRPTAMGHSFTKRSVARAAENPARSAGHISVTADQWP